MTRRQFARFARSRRAWIAFSGALIGLLMATPTVSAATFSNPAPITINDNANASPFPSTINVSGMTGTLSDVNVTLNGLQHTAVQDIGVALVTPSGLGLEVMADVGFDLAPGVTYTFDDGAPTQFPFNSTPPSGSYRPAVHFRGSDFFPSPCLYTSMLKAPPDGSPQGTLASLNGVDPNGTWELCVRDFVMDDSGSIGGGWSIDLSTPPAGPTGRRAAALKKCKKKPSKVKRSKCRKRAKKLPV
jgi:subtilisin-like proprotein convertase family protein